MDDRITPTEQTALVSSPILTTKLHRPWISNDLVPRSDLLERLDCSRQQPLTLISAPAGYGKTSLASLWLQKSDCVSAWVSLDEGDNDLRTFTTYLTAAVVGAFRTINLTTQTLLDAPILPPAPVLARYLLNDLNQIGAPFFLALDDIHLIHAQAILDFLTELLHHPSGSMHIVLIGRRDPPLPIASLRAHGLVTEIRARDLRLTTAQTARLLSTMLRREVDEEIAREWAERTEGWVTGLRLAALFLRSRDATDDLSIRVTGQIQYLQDYLLAEVLAYLPAAKREWLLLTSLMDRFCVSLCEAVNLSDTDSDEASQMGKDFIHWLQDENLFLVSLDDRSDWFRFHHLFQQLLQKILREHLEPDKIAAAHLRASRWFDDNGLWDEALRHLLAAGDTSGALQYVAQHRHQLINTERWSQLERWVGWFPDEVVANDPILLLTKARLPSAYGGDWWSLPSRARSLVASMPENSLTVKEVLAEAACFSSMVAMLTGPAQKAVADATEALALLPPQAQHVRSLAIGAQAVGYQMSGEFAEAVRSIEEAVRDPSWPPNARARLHLSLSFVSFLEGSLAAVQQSAGNSRALATQYHLWDTLCQGHYLSGIAHYRQNELAMAEFHLLRLTEQPALSDPHYLVHAVCALTRIYDIQQQPEKANAVLRLTRSHLEQVGAAFSLETLDAFQVELALNRGNPTLARRLSLNVNFDERHPFWHHYALQLTPIKLLLAEGTPEKLEQAMVSLERIDTQLLKIHRKVFRIDVLALQALIHDVQGDQRASREKLTEALLLAEPGGFIRNFVDLGQPMAGLLARLRRHQRAFQPSMMHFVSRLLAAFPTWDSSGAQTDSSPDSFDSLRAQPETRVSLTKRESQVLQLLATSMSPEEIARELVVSTSTVRTHIKNIYAKMDAHNRTEALLRAGVLRQQ